MKKKSKVPGKVTSSVEVMSISKWGLWLLVNDQEFFLPFSEYPWFEKAIVEQVCNVEMIHSNHIRWPDIDVDLELECLKNPEKYPLVYKK